MEPGAGRGWQERALAFVPPLLGALVFAVALLVLRRELAEFRLVDVAEHLRAIPVARMALAGALTVASYGLLTGYDALALRWIGRPLGPLRTLLASFLGFVFSHNVGVSFLGGGAVRYRLLSSWNVPAGEIARVIAFNIVTFWLGVLGLGGALLALRPLPIPSLLHASFATSRPIGVALLAGLVLWLAASAVWRTPLRIRGFDVPIPRPGTTLAQLVLSAADWALAALCFWVLLPGGSGLSFGTFLAAYLLAQVIGLASHVPGGLGVLEGILVLLLAPWLPGDAILGSAVAYRIVYYLAPLVLGVTLLAGYEVLQRRRQLGRAREILARLAPAVLPRVFALAVLWAGLVLLVSGATPGVPGRTAWLAPWLPLPLIEASHLLGSVIGVALLLLARALQQRIDAAWLASLLLLAAGALASLAKGLDWEEAALLAIVLAALLPCRRFFYRRSSLLSQSFTPEWIVGIGLALIGTAGITLFAYRHVEYHHQLWWEFELASHAPRSLRALVGASVALAAYALARLLRPAPPALALPDEAALARAQAIVERAPRASAHLALLGDKHLLFREGDDAMVMYGVAGRSWIAMGDPVGPPDARRELAWRFVEEADRHGGRASFYEVSPVDLPLYVDLGLSLRKLGEEARVPLEGFSLAGRHRARLRHPLHKLERDGHAFEVVPAPLPEPLLEEAREVSDAWLAHKNTREKRFSLGFFAPDYLRRLPLACVRHRGRLIAFANVWAGSGKEELSVDLMRYRPDAPNGTMDYLFVQAMRWGQEQGHRWFSLGMAPLSGLEQHRLARPWNRLGALLFRYGEHFYNFQGLREFKDKFEPMWEPRYLASPGGLAVPVVLTRVAILVSGGLRGVVAK